MRRLRRDAARRGQHRPRLAWLLPVGLALGLAGCAATSGERASEVQSQPLLGFLADMRQPVSDIETHSARAPGGSMGMSKREQDALIAQAITAHEMRRP